MSNPKDIRESLAYYVETLGFKQDWATDTLGQVSRDGYGIMFRQQAEVRSQEIWLGVTLLEPIYEEFVANGAMVHQEPMNHPWAYDAKIKDLDGHILWIGSGPKPAT